MVVSAINQGHEQLRGHEMFDEYLAKQRARRESARADLRRIRGEVRRETAAAFAPVVEEIRAVATETRDRVAEQRAEHDRVIAEHDDGLVAAFDRVRLYPDRIVVVPSSRRKDRGLAPDSRPLAGVRARINEDRNGLELGGWDQRDVYLTISGPGFEWSIRTDAVWSSRKARDFAALVNSRGSASAPAGAPVDVAGQLRQLAELHQAGELTAEEYAAAKQRALG
jgi:hypothetical protein